MLSINPNALADAIVSQLKTLGIAVETSPQSVPQPSYSAPKPAQGAIATGQLESAAEAVKAAREALDDAQNELEIAEIDLQNELGIVIDQLKARGVKLPEGVSVMVLDGSGVLTTAQV